MDFPVAFTAAMGSFRAGSALPTPAKYSKKQKPVLKPAFVFKAASKSFNLHIIYFLYSIFIL
jgi:hypothetical protein